MLVGINNQKHWMRILKADGNCPSGGRSAKVCSMKRLNGKVVLLTGAGSGIERALAKGFLRDGARVVALNRSPTTRKSSLQNKHWITMVGDVRSEKDVLRAVNTAVDRFGRIDILVNNAGVNHTCEFVTQEPAVWAEQILVNLVGAARPKALKRCPSSLRMSAIHPSRGPYLISRRIPRQKRFGYDAMVHDHFRYGS
jgi:NAD(P)-dependent dehydrogenase (short-subunit alcohol dehydrogenase family)